MASRRGKVDVEKGTPLEKLAAAMNFKNKGGSTGTSSSGIPQELNWYFAYCLQLGVTLAPFILAVGL